MRVRGARDSGLRVQRRRNPRWLPWCTVQPIIALFSPPATGIHYVVEALDKATAKRINCDIAEYVTLHHLMSHVNLHLFYISSKRLSKSLFVCVCVCVCVCACHILPTAHPRSGK